MAENQQDLGRKIATGLQWEGLLFLKIWKEIERRYGREVAREICGKGMWEAGLVMGAEAAKEVDSNDLAGMVKAWEIIYPVAQEDIVELNEERFVYKSSGCAAFEMWKKAGVTAEEAADMADSYCGGDRAFAEGFNRNIACVHDARAMKGDSECRWVHYVKK